MDRTAPRFLATSALLLVTLLILMWLGPLVPSAPLESEANRLIFTLDRGGIVRFNNGKIDVQTAYHFNLDEGPLQIPRVIESWEGVDFPLNLEAAESLKPELLINRVYSNVNRETVFLTVLGANTSRKLHRPEICYRAADWTLNELPVYNVKLNPGEVGVGRILARNNKLNEQRIILYWYLWRDGRRRIEDGAFVMQVAAPIVNDSMDAALATAERFTRLLLRRTVSSPPLARQLSINP